jgi:hypothetical protein
MMGVTFASVAPMVAMANATPGVAGAQLIFGAIIGSGIVAISDCAGGEPHAALLSAGGHRHHHRHDRHQPDAHWHQLDFWQPVWPHCTQRGERTTPSGWRMVHGAKCPGAAASALPPVPKGLAWPDRFPTPSTPTSAASALQRWCWCPSC